MKVLEQGKIMKVNGQDAWIIASLNIITSDLPLKIVPAILNYRLIAN